MAITITSQPTTSQINLSYFPVVYKFTSNAGADLVSCIIEVLIDGVRVSAKSVQKDIGSSNAFTVDISNELIKNTSSGLVTLGSYDTIQDLTNLCKFKIKIYEVTNPSGTLTTSYDPDDASNSSYQKITADCVAGNWIESQYDYASFNYVDYQFSDSTTNRKFLTESPLTKDIELGQNEFLGIASYVPLGTYGYKLEVLTYNASNALLNTDYINITQWATTWSNLEDVIDDCYLYLGVGTSNLIASGVSLTSVAYYTVRIINTAGDRSELRRYNIVESCNTDVRLHWFNKFGKQESLTFKGNIIEGIDYKSSSYEQALPITYSSSSRGTATIQTIRSNNFTIYTKSIGRLAYQHAMSIMNNNNAYIEVSGNYHAITIDDLSVTKRNEKDMPIQLSLSYRLANRDKGLRG